MDDLIRTVVDHVLADNPGGIVGMYLYGSSTTTGYWMGNVDPAERRTPDEFGIRARFQCWWWCGNEGHARFVSSPGSFDVSFHCPKCAEERRAERQRFLQLPVWKVPKLVEAWRDPRPYAGLTVAHLDVGVAGKRFGQSYQLRYPKNHKLDTVVGVYVSTGCPWCPGNETRRNSPPLAGTDPEIAVTGHPHRNGNRAPDNTPSNYSKPLWWKSVQCCGYEWQETIEERAEGRRPQRRPGHYYCPWCKFVSGAWHGAVLRQRLSGTRETPAPFGM